MQLEILAHSLPFQKSFLCYFFSFFPFSTFSFQAQDLCSSVSAALLYSPALTKDISLAISLYGEG